MILNILKAREEINRLESLVACTEERATVAEQKLTLIAETVRSLESAKLELIEANSALEQANQKLSAELEKIQQSKTDFAADVDRAASAKAVEIVAAVGVAPVRATESVAVTKTVGELWAEYQALPTQAERSAFYRKNRSILFN
jgi:DNA repair exonuclease SbcCD ATPase subunit